MIRQTNLSVDVQDHLGVPANLAALRKPSVFKRILIRGALGRGVFDSRGIHKLDFFDGAIIEYLINSDTDDRLLLVLAYVAEAMLLVASRLFFPNQMHEFFHGVNPAIKFILGSVLAPTLPFLSVLGILSVRWLWIGAKRNVFRVLARVVCPVELEYYRIQGFQRISHPVPCEFGRI